MYYKILKENKNKHQSRLKGGFDVFQKNFPKKSKSYPVNEFQSGGCG